RQMCIRDRLFADPGAPLASDPGEPWLALLGWPSAPSELAFLGGWAAWVVPLVASGTVVVAALLAMARGTGRARAVRVGWVLAGIGVAATLVSSRVAVGVGRGVGDNLGADENVHGWAGPGTSLVLLGLLLATVSAGDGLKGALSGRSFGWRQLSAALVTVVVVLGPLLAASVWTVGVFRERSSDEPAALVTIGSRGGPPVPALGIELQSSDQRARVLALSATADAVDAQLWRGDGPQLIETSTAVESAGLTGSDPASVVAPDAAAGDLAELVAALATGTATDAAARLSAHAIAVVIVPPVDSRVTGVHEADEAARSRLVALLDSVLGLERVTQNDSGVIWRVRAGAGSTDASIARAQVLDGAGALVQNVASAPTVVDGEIGVDGASRTLVLAERSDSAWHAWLDGEPLRAVPTGWRQAFSIPDGASGQVLARYEPPLQTTWRVTTTAVLAFTVLVALPTRRRRLEDD
ncbi:MAG: hypothetical protein JJE50_13565, partial [Actinomycetales bacterium]|nr:hypothetical protein [Actinomycetales bacterium]